jgi:predicted component of type VI protein secretion system
MEARLFVVGGKANKGHVTLRVPAIIGRSRQAGLTISHPMVSRRHCELFEVHGMLRIRDLGSLNGTYLGSEKITEAPLRPSDEITIGPLTFRVDYEFAGEATALEFAPIEQLPETPTPESPPTSVPDGVNPPLKPPSPNGDSKADGNSQPRIDPALEAIFRKTP